MRIRTIPLVCILLLCPGAGTPAFSQTVDAITSGQVTQAVVRGAHRLQELQNADGGWYFRAADTSCGSLAFLGGSCHNVVGVTGLGLLSAHRRAPSAGVLQNAIAAGQLLIAIHDAAPAQPPFSQDLEFLRALSDASGDPQYAALATGWFGAITAAYPNAADRADLAFARRDASRLRSLAVWDLASLIRSAKAAGDADYALALANRVVEREADWKDLDPSHRWDQCAIAAGCGAADNPRAFDYTLLGMGSFLWAIHDLPGFDATIEAYRSWLLSQQDAEGTWDAGNLQITSYVALGLGAVGGEGVDTAVDTAVEFLIDAQLAGGGWPFSIAGTSIGAEYSTVDSEVIRAIDLLYSTDEGTAVTVAPAQLATLNFEEVAAAGETTVVARTDADMPRIPNGYALLEGLTYDVATTATVRGRMVMCVSVPWQSLTDRYGDLRLLQARGKKKNDRYDDVTIVKGAWAPDATTNRVCGELASFSPVSLALQR